MKRSSFVLPVLLILVLSFSLASCGGGGGANDPATPSSSKSITSFSFTNTNPVAIGTINETTKTISVTVPSGTPVTALVATFATTGQSVKVNGTVQTSGVTQNNFNNPVTYTVVAADASTQNYIVTVTVGPLQAQWARTASVGNDTSSAHSSLYSVISGTDGYVYAAGTIDGYAATYDFGNLVTASVGTYAGDNGLLVKYDSLGTAQWAKAVKVPNNTNTSSFVSLATGTDGSLYAAGSFQGPGPFDFGNGITTSPTYTTGLNVLLVKYDNSGNSQWVRTVTGGNNDSWLSGIVVAADGSIYICGYIYGNNTFDFGSGVTAAGTTSYNRSALLVKYDPAGTAQWARTIAGGASSFSSVVVSNGFVYAAGSIWGVGTYNFGSTVTAAAAGSGDNVVLVKYDSSGNAKWAQTTAAGSEKSSFAGLAAASDGSIYAAGLVFGNGTFGFGNSVTVTAPYSSGYNFLLVKYDSSGLAQWAKVPASASNSSSFYNVAVGTDGAVYTAGYIYGATAFGFGSITATAGYSSGDSLLMAKYSSTGVAQVARTVSGSDPSECYGVSAAPDGSVYVVGKIGFNSYNFGDGITAYGASLGSNLILLKYK